MPRSDSPPPSQSVDPWLERPTGRSLRVVRDAENADVFPEEGETQAVVTFNDLIEGGLLFPVDQVHVSFVVELAEADLLLGWLGRAGEVALGTVVTLAVQGDAPLSPQQTWLDLDEDKASAGERRLVKVRGTDEASLMETITALADMCMVASEQVEEVQHEMDDLQLAHQISLQEQQDIHDRHAEKIKERTTADRAQISELQKSLARCQQRLEEILASRSWRIGHGAAIVVAAPIKFVRRLRRG